MRQAIQPAKFQRRSFKVSAIRVTAENMDLVATWCKGEIQTLVSTSAPHTLPQKYIKVNVVRPQADRQTQAFIGDWVVSARGFKVYTDQAFRATFEAIRDAQNISMLGDEVLIHEDHNYGAQIASDPAYPGYESHLVGPNCD